MSTSRVSASVPKEQEKKLKAVVKKYYKGVLSPAIDDAITLLCREAEAGRLVPRNSALVEPSKRE